MQVSNFVVAFGKCIWCFTVSKVGNKGKQAFNKPHQPISYYISETGTLDFLLMSHKIMHMNAHEIHYRMADFISQVQVFIGTQFQQLCFKFKNTYMVL